MTSDRTLRLIYVLVAALAVYVFAHWDALTNPYVQADDTRQQIFWMQQWIDPGLYADDLLAAYARNYVPWGVQAIYALFAPLVDPMQLTKVLSGILYVMTAGFLFGLGLAFRDELTPVLVVATFCFFGDFADRIAGGISQSFGYPLLTAFLFFLSRKNLTGIGAVVALASVLNPYVFLLCLVTQGLFLLHNYGRPVWERLFARSGAARTVQDSRGNAAVALSGGNSQQGNLIQEEVGTGRILPAGLVASLVLAVMGCLLMGMKYVLFKSTEFGELVTAADMLGKVEYTSAGRYELMPVPSLLFELVRPWLCNLPFKQWGPVPSIFFMVMGGVAVVYACTRKRWLNDVSGFRVFGYLFVSSLLLFVVARIFLFRLFVPSRYVELSLTVFYVVSVAVCFREVFNALISRRVLFPLVTTLLFIIAALRLYHVGIYDYSDNVGLYRFVQSTPKNSLMAGHPDLMDNVLTFGRRKAFVTYELSHTWYKSYWREIEKRTFGFFDAYYSDDPESIRKFCRENKIDYLIVRASDFSPREIDKKGFYFEPFATRIKQLALSHSHYAVLDRKQFPPVYEMDGIRVIKVSDRPVTVRPASP